MTTKKKVITNDARYREDFKKAVDAEVELRMKKHFSDENARFGGIVDSLMEEQARQCKGSETYTETIKEKLNRTTPFVGQPSSQFHSRTLETMGYIDSLSTIVDEFIDALSPILVPNSGNIEKVPVPTNDTIGSEFNEFLSCAERRIDSIRAKISEAMSRRTI